MYVLDTNVYVDADEIAFASALAAFLARRGREVVVSSVVVAELLVGLHDERLRTDVLARLYATAGMSGTLTPTHDDWVEAGDALRALGGLDVTPRRSFWNDILLAASCYRAGATLVTSNRDDFRRIVKHIPVHFVAPWPS